MTDDEREDWANNDEGLYDLQRASGLGMRAWVRANRPLIDDLARGVANGTRRQHDLKYGPKR